MIKQKGLNEYLKDDLTLTKKVTSEKLKISIKTGFDDSEIYEAYEEYNKVVSGEPKSENKVYKNVMTSETRR